MFLIIYFILTLLMYLFIALISCLTLGSKICLVVINIGFVDLYYTSCLLICFLGVWS